MKAFLTSCLLVLLVFSNSPIYAEIYYVKSNGDDSQSGLSDDMAWCTIGRVNSHQFEPGDMVLLKRNSVFSDASFKNPDVDNFKIADYGSGEKPRIDGNSVAPVQIKPITPISNLTIKSIDISGQNWSSNKGSNILISNVRNVLIEDVIGDGYKGSLSPTGKTAITLEECDGQIIVRNCNLSNWGPENLLEATRDYMGIVIYQQLEGEYLIENCVIQHIGADGIHLFDSEAPGRVVNNTVVNCGEEGIDVKGSDNVQIFDNRFFRTSEFTGQGGSGVNFPAHVKIHNGRARPTSSNIQVSGNSFRNGDAVGLLTANSSDIVISSNLFFNLPTFIKIGNYANNTIIQDNVFHSPVSRILAPNSLETGCIFESNIGTGTKIINNTFFNEQGSCSTMITLGCSYETAILKNVIYNVPFSSFVPLALFIRASAQGPIVLNNCMYTASDNPFEYEGDFSEDKIKEVIKTNCFKKPQFIDASNGNLNLSTKTPCHTGGKFWGASNPLLSEE